MIKNNNVVLNKDENGVLHYFLATFDINTAREKETDSDFYDMYHSVVVREGSIPEEYLQTSYKGSTVEQKNEPVFDSSKVITELSIDEVKNVLGSGYLKTIFGSPFLAASERISTSTPNNNGKLNIDSSRISFPALIIEDGVVSYESGKVVALNSLYPLSLKSKVVKSTFSNCLSYIDLETGELTFLEEESNLEPKINIVPLRNGQEHVKNLGSKIKEIEKDSAENYSSLSAHKLYSMLSSRDKKNQQRVVENLDLDKAIEENSKNLLLQKGVYIQKSSSGEIVSVISVKEPKQNKDGIVSYKGFGSYSVLDFSYSRYLSPIVESSEYEKWEGTESELIKEILIRSDEGGRFRTPRGYGFCFIGRKTINIIEIAKEDFSQINSIEIPRVSKVNNSFYAILNGIENEKGKSMVQEKYEEARKSLPSFTDNWEMIYPGDADYCIPTIMMNSIDRDATVLAIKKNPNENKALGLKHISLSLGSNGEIVEDISTPSEMTFSLKELAEINAQSKEYESLIAVRYSYERIFGDYRNTSQFIAAKSI